MANPTVRYVCRRVAIYLFTLWASVTLAFFLFRFMPGDPMSVVLGTLSQNTGKVAGNEEIAAYYRRLYELDRPVIVQYFKYIYNVVTGPLNLGPSFTAFPRPVQELIAFHMPWTLGLVSVAMLIAWLLGTAIGTLVGWWRHRRISTLAVLLSTFFAIVPVYILGIALIMLMGYTLKVLPTGRPYSPGLEPDWTSWSFIADVLRHAILPILAMLLVWGANFVNQMRALTISVLGEDYLTYAKAKGLKPTTILRRYAFRNALLPQVAGLGIVLGATLNGAYLIEVIFLYPGLGGLFARASGIRDFNVMQGVILFSSFAVLTGSLIVDLMLPLLDPRIRRSND
ncbi:MAG: peptide ABC transporter permease [Candidatus Roseilinea sp.]|nr:MAG: peptide ABC transporter permease [Candidatus Roseilinea sp.]